MIMSEPEARGPEEYEPPRPASEIFRRLPPRHALQRGAVIAEEAADAGRIALGELAQPPADRLLDEPFAIAGKACGPTQHPLRIAVARPGEGEDEGGPPRPQVRALHPAFGDVEAARIVQQAARGDRGEIVGHRPAVEVGQARGHETP